MNFDEYQRAVLARYVDLGREDEVESRLADLGLMMAGFKESALNRRDAAARQVEERFKTDIERADRLGMAELDRLIADLVVLEPYPVAEKAIADPAPTPAPRNWKKGQEDAPEAPELVSITNHSDEPEPEQPVEFELRPMASHSDEVRPMRTEQPVEFELRPMASHSDEPEPEQVREAPRKGHWCVVSPDRKDWVGYAPLGKYCLVGLEGRAAIFYERKTAEIARQKIGREDLEILRITY